LRQLTLSEWPRIKAGLEVLLGKAPDDWIPEDVYVAIATGSHQAIEIGTGFAVVQAQPYIRGRMLFVWCLYMPPENDKRAVIDALDSLARSCGCGLIRFHSSRDGWARYLEDEFEVTAKVYERKINGFPI
jgi:hypothetical protein